MKPADRKAWREVLGLNQRQWGDVLAVHATSVSRWESEDRPVDGLADRVFIALSMFDPRHPAMKKWGSAAGRRVAQVLELDNRLAALAVFLDRMGDLRGMS